MTIPPFFSVDYLFWPVGQGLFSSGVLRGAKGSRPFRWVYDCGTTSSQKLIKKAIAEYGQQFAESAKPKIDLVVISHFDKDHISGMVELLSKFSVGTLLLPYMPLWQRLVVAFSSGVDSQQRSMSFFVDPVGFVREASGNNGIDRVLFVTPGGDEPAAQGPGDVGGDGPDGFVLHSKQTRSQDWDDEQTSLTLKPSKQTRGAPPKVEFLEKNGRLLVGSIWEFVPYNDAGAKVIAGAGSLAVFKNEVEKERKKLLESPSRESIGRLRDIYDARFGADGVGRNLISLFVYGGPVDWAHSYNAWALLGVELHKSHKNLAWRASSGRCSVLHTGDGYLNSKVRFEKLGKCLGRARMAEISTFQVMHHGAVGSWFRGIAKMLSPDFSIFSSDPDHKKYLHPHGDVVKDFLSYGPLQVDRVNLAQISYRFV